MDPETVLLEHNEGYDVLPPSKRLKLCRIYDGNADDPIVCTLKPTALDGSTSYKCLSYVWGSKDHKEVIELNGKQHAVTGNLYAALRRLRGMTTNIWIDALCINQEDDAEKGEQVAMVSDIVRQADEVLVWLGEPGMGIGSVEWEANAKKAVLFPIVEQSLELLSKDAHFHDLPIRSDCVARVCPALLGDLSIDGHPWADVVAALRAWFDAASFERAWTVQELVLAQRATFILGPDRLTWDTISRAWVNLGRHSRGCCTECVYGLRGDDSDHIYTMACNVIGLSAARTKLEEGQHLIEPLLQFSRKQATNLLDRLYGLLGLQSGARPTPAVQDYTASLQTIFSRSAADVVRTQGWLVPLCLDLRQELTDMPSWVPDWTVQPTYPTMYTVSRFVWSFSYSTAKDFGGQATVTDDYTLEVDGM